VGTLQEVPGRKAAGSDSRRDDLQGGSVFLIGSVQNDREYALRLSHLGVRKASCSSPPFGMATVVSISQGGWPTGLPSRATRPIFSERGAPCLHSLLPLPSSSSL
jgi:hypothetical protein